MTNDHAGSRMNMRRSNILNSACERIGCTRCRATDTPQMALTGHAIDRQQWMSRRRGDPWSTSR